jgi:DNA-binding NarL/FixJ family response regulator
LDGVLFKVLLPGANSVVMKRMSAARLLLIDDHAMFRSGLAVLMRMSIEGVEVIESGSMDEALHGPFATPDVILLDIVLKGLNGLEGIELLKRRWPGVSIIMVSSDATPQTVQQALTRGASAFVSKEQSAQSILDAVRKVLEPALGHADLQKMPLPAASESTRMTPRQLEVLDLLCQGMPNKAIGRKINLTENTVRWHVQSILALLEVSNRSEAAFAARQRGLIR